MKKIVNKPEESKSHASKINKYVVWKEREHYISSNLVTEMLMQKFKQLQISTIRSKFTNCNKIEKTIHGRKLIQPVRWKCSI